MTRRNILTGGQASGPTPPDGQPSDDSGAEPLAAFSGGGAGGRITALIDPERDLACARLPLTDLGNAERWRIRHGDAYRFCDVLGWFAWDGRRWKLLSEEKDRLPARVMQSVFATVRAIRNEAALVAASGYPNEILTAKEERELAAWAEAHGITSRELYLSGDDDGARQRWLEERDPMDVVLGKGQLWSYKIAAWAKTSEGMGKLSSVAALAKSFSEIAIDPEQLDNDRMAINVLNGTLRLKRKAEKRSQADIEAGKSEWHMAGWEVKLHPHDRADLITKLAPVKYSRTAKSPHYDAFIEKVQPDPHMRRFLHQWGGYSLTGDITEHKLAFFHGEGRNGKGTWVEAIANLAGDYAGAIGIESLLASGGQRRGDQATPDLAELPGVRFLRVSEPQKGMAFNDGLLKQLSGGDPVKARHLNKGFFQFFPDFKLTISGNTKPVVKDVSHGFWERLQLVPWGVVITAAEIDRELPAKLKAEASGILARLIEGLIDWKENGLIIPDQVRMATRTYREDSDDIGRFLAQLCEVSDGDPRVRVGAKDLHDLYIAWAEVSGGATLHIKGFKRAMQDKGFVQKPSDGNKWIGVRPRAEVTLDRVKAGDFSQIEEQELGGDPSGPAAEWDDYGAEF